MAFSESASRNLTISLAPNPVNEILDFSILRILRCCSKVKENVTLTTKEQNRLDVFNSATCSGADIRKRLSDSSRERWVETMIPESY